MADKKPKKLLGTSRTYDGKGQYYVAPSNKTPKERADKTSSGKTVKRDQEPAIWMGTIKAGHEARLRNGLNVAKENRGAKKRVGKNRGGK
jgi:hypothetical protein